MKLKTIEVNGSTYAEVQDGKPVYVAEDGKEVAFDAPHAVAAIKTRNAEAKAHREAKEALEAQVKAFEGLDPEAARRALETVGNLDAKKLIDAGEVEKVKREAQEAYQRKLDEVYKPVAAERDQLKNMFHQEKLSTAFGRSEFVAKKLAIPPDMAQAAFGSRFYVADDGSIATKGPDGNPIYSRSKPGELAGFDEAMEILVDAYPHRDRILAGSGASGGGANGSRTGAGGARQYTRAQFEAMPPAEQMKTSQEAAAGKAEIVDN